MSPPHAVPQDQRPLANPGPVLFITGLGVLAIVGLVLSSWRDPGLPAHLAESYMRVAGGLLTPAETVTDAASLSAALSRRPPGAVRVPSLEPQGYQLAGGGHVSFGGRPAAVAIYRNVLQDLVVWHAIAGRVESLPATGDVRDDGGRRYFLHHKATTIVALWQEGAMVASVTSTLPADQVMALARGAATGAGP